MQPDLRTTAIIHGEYYYCSVGVLSFVVNSFSYSFIQIKIYLLKDGTSIFQPCCKHQGYSNEEKAQCSCSHAFHIPDNCFFLSSSYLILRTNICSAHYYSHFSVRKLSIHPVNTLLTREFLQKLTPMASDLLCKRILKHSAQ